MNVAEQRCIESSKAFLRGEITLEGTYPVDDVEVVSEQVVENKETIMVEGITTVQAAREYHVAEKGAKASAAFDLGFPWENQFCRCFQRKAYRR